MIVNHTRNTTIASKVKIADTPWSRMRGLLGESNFLQGEALVITRCQSIHMFFMKFAIDVIFCNSQDQVIGRCLNIKPYQLSPVFFKASYAIELPLGSIVESQTQIGDKIQLNIVSL